MKVVILCGGFGTRIRGTYEDIPKPMIPLGQFPIMWHIMKYFSTYGHNEFILCLGYKAAVIKDYFTNYRERTKDFTISLGNQEDIEYHTDHSESDWRVTLANTGLNAMTGARVRRIERYLGDEDFFLTYGDGVGDIDLNALEEFHQGHGKTLTVTGVRPPSRFGEIVHDEEGVIKSFNEKPQVGSGRISGGFFLCKKEIFEYLDDREDLVFEVDPLARVLEKDEFRMYRHDGFWQPMDTYRDFTYLNKLLENGDAPWKRW